MDDFSKYEEYMFRVASALATSKEYQQLAFDSLKRGDYTVARFQLGQELRWYSAYASLRDAIETGEVKTAVEYQDEFIANSFGVDSPYLPMKAKVSELMNWDSDKVRMDERIVSRFLDSISVGSEKVV